MVTRKKQEVKDKIQEQARLAIAHFQQDVEAAIANLRKEIESIVKKLEPKKAAKIRFKVRVAKKLLSNIEELAALIAILNPLLPPTTYTID